MLINMGGQMVMEGAVPPMILRNIAQGIHDTWKRVTTPQMRNVIGGAAAAATGAGLLGVGPAAGLKGLAGKAAGAVKGGNTLQTVRNIAGVASAAQMLGGRQPEVPQPRNPYEMMQANQQYQQQDPVQVLNPELQDMFARRIEELRSLEAGEFDKTNFDRWRQQEAVRQAEEAAERGQVGSSMAEQRHVDADARIALQQDQFLSHLRNQAFQELMGIYGQGDAYNQRAMNMAMNQAGLAGKYDLTRYEADIKRQGDIERNLAGLIAQQHQPQDFYMRPSTTAMRGQDQGDEEEWRTPMLLPTAARR